MEPKKYHIITYGCQMNVHESEKLAGVLKTQGYAETPVKEDADIIVLNTCCIRETAESHVLGNLGQIKKLKENKPSLKVAVCGCMTQKDEGAEKLKKRCPFIDIIFGTHNLDEFGTYLKESDSKKRVVDVWDKERGIAENTPLFRTSGLNAWVNIMYGCDNFCSYCIVPYVRGRERSRITQNILDEVKKLSDEGYKEITLLGQNVNSYGADFSDKSITFPFLLEKIAKTAGKIRIKFMTSHPKDFSIDLIKVMAGFDNIAKFVHLPVQSGSDRILKLMNRKYTAGEYLDKIGAVKKYMPEAGLSTDIMVGFPTEEEEDFEDTLKLIRKVEYSNVYSFIYSKRSGTAAEKMDGQIEQKIKKDRIKRLIDEQFLIGKSIADALKGKTLEVLCIKQDGNAALGRTSCNRLVKFSAEKDILGKFGNVKITRANNSNLYGEMLNAD